MCGEQDDGERMTSKLTQFVYNVNCAAAHGLKGLGTELHPSLRLNSTRCGKGLSFYVALGVVETV